MIETIGYISILFPWLLGMLTIWHWVKSIKETPEIKATGFDCSNRINRIKLWWQNGREPWELAQYKEFKYLRYDVDEQAKIIEESEKSRLKEKIQDMLKSTNYGIITSIDDDKEYGLPTLNDPSCPSGTTYYVDKQTFEDVKQKIGES